jgi:hypothetical protein
MLLPQTKEVEIRFIGVKVALYNVNYGLFVAN